MIKTVVLALHWRCLACGCRRYVLVQRGLERLSWCLDCYGEEEL